MNLLTRLLSPGFVGPPLGFLFLLLQLLNTVSFAQQIEPNYISISEGLVNPNVQDIIQDRYGLIWVATGNGMQRYDGYQFETFKNLPDKPNSLLNNNVWGLAEDDKGNIWVATDLGISRFDRMHKTFVNYDLVKHFNMASGNATVFNFYFDSRKRFWAVSGSLGILLYDKDADQWNMARFDSSDTTKTSNSIGFSIGITEDQSKNLWVGSSAYGLMKLSASDSVFRPVPDILNEVDFTDDLNTISALYADSLGAIWITSRNGVYKYYPDDGSIKVIAEYDYNRENGWNNWNSIQPDHHGNIWIANNYRGVLKFEGVSDQFQEVSFEGTYRLKGMGLNITMTDFLIDKSGIFYFGNRTQGIIKYDPEQKPFTLYAHDEANKNSLSHSGIFGILASKVKPGIIYVGTRAGGLNIFDSRARSFQQVSYQAINDFYGGAVRSIGEDDDGTLWIGTWGDGLIELDQDYNEIKRYIYDPNSENSISDDRVRVIKKDSKGNFWIGTNNGLNYFDPELGEFERIPAKPSRAYDEKLIGSLEDLVKTKYQVSGILEVADDQNLTQSFLIEEEEDYIIICVGEGTPGSMVDFGWIQNTQNDTLWNAFDYEETYYAGGAGKNRILIDQLRLSPGSYGLHYISDDSHSYENWNEPEPDKTSLYGIVLIKNPDGEDEIPIESLMNQKDEKLVISGVNISAIEITDEYLWIGTNTTGLNSIKLADNTVKTYLNDPNDENSLSNNIIYDLHIDNNGIIWITTEEGINRLDPVTEKFVRYTEEDGLPTNLTESILSGEDGEIWISTQSGLSQMVVNESLGKVTFINYNAEDGLGGDTFLAQTATRTPDGKLYFGGDHGLNVVSEISANNVPPDLFFNNMFISNKSIYEMGDESPFSTNLNEQDEINLSHDENNLSFEFSALHYSNPLKNQYAHILKGYDKDWIYDNRNYASYTNLDPGEYEFSIRASNAYGVWNEDGKTIKIMIAPPWYRTWLAYAGYGLVFLIFLYVFDRSMRSRLIRREREKNRERELEQAKEIEKAYKELKATQSQLIQSEKMASLGELTAGIAHEIQNPLNFVNNFSDVSIDLMDELDDEMKDGNEEEVELIKKDLKSNLEKIHNHGQRASSIVKGMLSHSRMGNREKELTDINVLADEYLRLAYHGLRAKDKSFKAEFKAELDESLPKVKVNSQDIGRVLLNIINNAFYAVASKAQNGNNGFVPEVIVKTKKLDNKVEIRIKDNADGIPSDLLDKIFQPFFTTKPSGQGTGLGLSLSYDIITKGHEGRLDVDTKKGEGTEFIIELPIKP